MSTTFDPDKLGAKTGGGAPRARSERVFVAVEEYATPSDGFHYAVGRRIDTDEPVRVRLNTVPERLADRPKENPEKVNQQYVSGEHRRDSIADKAKAVVPLMSFDDARKVGENDGVAEYRAHWPKTMAVDPKAEPMWGFAHVRLREAVEQPGGAISKSQAYVELFKSAAIATKENIGEVLEKTFANKDENGNARDPMAIMRVVYEGRNVSTVRVYADKVPTPIFDQATGQTRNVPRLSDAATTIHKLMEGGAGTSDFDTRQRDLARAIIAGISGAEAPKFASSDERVITDAANLYAGAKAGALTVEIISAEKLDFGKDSRQTYLKERDRSHLAAYQIREEGGDHTIKETPGYTETMLAVSRHADGEPYVVFASPAEMYPRITRMADLPLGVAPRMELASEAALEAPKPQAAAPAAGANEPAEEEPAYDGPGM